METGARENKSGIILKKLPYIIILLFSLICAEETIIGIIQFFKGLLTSNPYRITGSFVNTGTYGGFLSVCVSILIAYNNKNPINNKYLDKGIKTIIIITLLILPSTMSRSALLALGISITALLLRIDRTRKVLIRILRIYGVYFFLFLGIICVGGYLIKKPSADVRFFMDKICLRAIKTNNNLGAGIGNFGGEFGESQASFFKELIIQEGSNDLDWEVIDDDIRLIADCPSDPFNEYLFFGMELGPIIMTLFILFILLAMVASYQRGTIWCYGLITFSVFAFFSNPLHFFVFQILFIFLMTACFLDYETLDNKEQWKNRWLRLSGKVVLSSIVIVSSLTVFAKMDPDIYISKDYKRSLSEWNESFFWFENEYYNYYVADCDNLLKYMNRNDTLLFTYGQSLSKIGYFERSDSILKLGTRISSDPMFWNVMGNNSLAQGKYREAEERYKHAFYMVPNRLYPLVLLAKLYYAEGDTARFLKMTDVVENFVPKVESIRTEKLRAEIRELKKSYLSEIEEKNED